VNPNARKTAIATTCSTCPHQKQGSNSKENATEKHDATSGPGEDGRVAATRASSSPARKEESSEKSVRPKEGSEWRRRSQLPGSTKCEIKREGFSSSWPLAAHHVLLLAIGGARSSWCRGRAEDAAGVKRANWATHGARGWRGAGELASHRGGSHMAMRASSSTAAAHPTTGAT